MTAGDRPPDGPTARAIRVAGEVLLLTLVALAPWPFGGVHPREEFFLGLGVCALVALWAAHAVVTRRFSYTSDAVSLCLLGLVLLTAIQLVPLPESVVRVLSPTAAHWQRTLTPELPELLPGEAEADVSRGGAWLRLSVAPAATEDLLMRLLAVFLVYAAARNFVAPGASFRRLAWVGFAAGVALAVLGLAQYLSGARTRIYWGEDLGYAIFGPFVNKNHFAFQVNLFAGLAGGLFLWVARRPGGWRSPAGLALLGGLGLMAAAVAFGQSRGGAIAAVAAAALVAVMAWSLRGRTANRGARAGLALAAGVILVAGALTAWFGWRGAAERFATLWGRDADNRTADWRAVWPLVEQFPLFGVGGGALSRAEPMVRTRPDLPYEFNTLDNEYLEALVEGGVLRFLLTLALAVAAVWVGVAAYRRNPDQPLELGSAFGLAAVAVQSAGDFGLHTPSVALTAAVVAAYLQGSGVRNRESAAAPNRGTAYTAAALLVLAGLLVALAERRLYAVDRLRLAAGTVLRSNAPDRAAAAIRYLEAAARLRPNDPEVWGDLVAVHVEAAEDRQQAALAALTGPLALVLPPASPPSGDPDGHIAAALKAARAGRDCQPLGPVPHLTLGTFAARFARSEPAGAHFDRARLVAGFDPDTWFATGRAAADRGDWPTAVAEWRESLSRSPKWLAPIARRAATHLAPDELRAKLLPDDPAVWFAATRFVFPHADDPRRAAWLRATAERWAAGPEPATVAGLVGWASALEQLGDTSAAVRVWRRAVERFPGETEPRDRLAARLEAEELYEEAVPVLEWLTARHPDRGDYRHRLEAARHALKLKADIDRP
jgi:O-antigen ligase